MINRPIAIAALFSVGFSAPVSAQSLRGRTVDEPSRNGLADVLVSVEDLSGSTIVTATTDGSGFFLVALPTNGSFVVRAARYGFSETRVTVEVRGGGEATMPALVLKPDVIVLDSLEAIVAGSDKVGFGRAMHRMSGLRIAAMERRGAWLEDALREMPGLRMHRDNNGNTCIESPRRIFSIGRMRDSNPDSCDMVVIILDGLQLWDARTWMRGMMVEQFESIEYMSPAEAGFRYGLAASAVGAIVLWSRGKGPYVDPLRNVR